MSSKKIPPNIKQQSTDIIERFNQQELKGVCNYIPRFSGGFLYLDRVDYNSRKSEICRLSFNGLIDNWDFAIFKYSSNKYDPNEWFHPGAQHLNGSIEGAMRCGLEAYPISGSLTKFKGLAESQVQLKNICQAIKSYLIQRLLIYKK